MRDSVKLISDLPLHHYEVPHLEEAHMTLTHLVDQKPLSDIPETMGKLYLLFIQLRTDHGLSTFGPFLESFREVQGGLEKMIWL